METLVSDTYKDGHFHDASEHGVTWMILNEMLHLIVFVYTLYGMIQFRVKFIHAANLVHWLSYVVIVHSWYLSIKFASIAIVMYLFNDKLESIGSISLVDYNCSLNNHQAVLEASSKRHEGLILLLIKRQINDASFANGTSINSSLIFEPSLSKQSSILSNNSTATSTLAQFEQLNFDSINDLISSWWTLVKVLHQHIVNLDYMLLYAQVLEIFGGPFRLLGNRATLMFGLYSVAIYIMLAIFPLELMYCNVGFNFIRFVLSDASCMRDLYKNRERHLERLASWSRNLNNSELTLGTKMILNQRDLRSRYADDYNSPVAKMIVANMSYATPESPMSCSSNEFDYFGQSDHEEENQFKVEAGSRGAASLARMEAGRGDRATKCSLSCRRNALKWANLYTDKMATAQYKITENIKPLRSRLAINHMDSPSYQVLVANRNLRKFKPFVRSERWFKLSMIIYPVFIVFYFSFLCLVIGFIAMYFSSSLSDVSDACARQVDPSINLWSNWTFLDTLLFSECQYTVFALSCASSFYCSYYFGTILELFVWRTELKQQMNLCRILVELSGHSQRDTGLVASILSHCVKRGEVGLLNAKTAKRLHCAYVSGGHAESADRCKLYTEITYELESIVEECFSEFGGMSSYWASLKLNQRTSPSKRLLALDLMAIRLLQKKQTILRAAYINMNLFFDELNQTRFMTETILRRTMQIAFGFAILASITRSQFKANYKHLTFLLAACLMILNLYLACAAVINSCVNKLLVQVHSLICATLRTNSEDADLFEFWVRHIRSFGEDRDVMSYKIYGYKVTWASIMNFDSVMCSAYFYTIY